MCCGTHSGMAGETGFLRRTDTFQKGWLLMCLLQAQIISYSYKYSVGYLKHPVCFGFKTTVPKAFKEIIGQNKNKWHLHMCGHLLERSEWLKLQWLIFPVPRICFEREPFMALERRVSSSGEASIKECNFYNTFFEKYSKEHQSFTNEIL